MRTDTRNFNPHLEKDLWVPLLKRVSAVCIVMIILFAVHFFPPLSLVKPFLKEHLGLQWNWIWAIDCLLFSVLLRRYWRITDKFIPQNTFRWFSYPLIGLLIGITLQTVFHTVFFVAGLPRSFAFRGFALETFLFQSFVSITEEILFRGTFQSYLGTIFNRKINSIGYSYACGGIVVSILFGLIHGLNPILRGYGGFDFAWFGSTFVFSLLTSIVFAYRRIILIPIGIHISCNYISSFF